MANVRAFRLFACIVRIPCPSPAPQQPPLVGKRTEGMPGTRPRTYCLGRSMLLFIGMFALGVPVANADLKGNARTARDANEFDFNDDGPQTQTGSVSKRVSPRGIPRCPLYINQKF